MPDDISPSAAAAGAAPTQASERGAAEQQGRESAREARATTLLPPTDIIETSDAIILLLDIPGADPASLNVTLDERRLTISARARQEPPPQGYSCVYAEYQSGNYER